MYTRNNLRTEYTENITATLRNKAGVYKIYYNRPINRVVGSDNSSLIYIGSAGSNNGLLKRIRDFFDSATNNTNAHSGGKFYHLALKNHFGEASDELKFDYEIKNTDLEATTAESQQLRDYLSKYGELPPLNNQLPKIL